MGAAAARRSKKRLCDSKLIFIQFEHALQYKHSSRPYREPMFEKCSVFRFEFSRIAIHIVDHFNFAYFAFWQNRRGGGVLRSFGE